MKKLTMKSIGTLIVGSVLALVTVLTPIAVAPLTAAQGDCENGINLQSGIACGQGEGVPTELFGEGSIFTTIVNVLLFIIGAISVIMLIIGGIRYTVSAGDSSNVTAAKNTILYALIGLVVAFLAFAVVNWVLVAITPGNS